MNMTKGHRGVRCGNCSTREKPVYHKHATAVRDCYDARYEDERQDDADQRAELAAERAAERYYEEGTPAQQAAYQAELDEETRRLGGCF